jgi:DNA adenine methylase
MRDKLTVSGYIGAKALLLAALVELLKFVGIQIYIEPYGGAYNVGINKARHKIEIYNDINPKLALLFKVLSNEEAGYELLQRMLHTEYSECEFSYAKFASNYMKEGRYSEWGLPEIAADIQKALYVWVTLLQSYNGQMRKWRGVSKGNEEFVYLDKLAKKFDIIDRLKNIQVLNMDAIELIKIYKNRPDVMIYCDPVYTRTERTCKDLYEYEMDDADQYRFAETIKDANAKIIVSGYKNPIYDSILTKENGWSSHLLAEVSKAASIGRLGEKRILHWNIFGLISQSV